MIFDQKIFISSVLFVANIIFSRINLEKLEIMSNTSKCLIFVTK